MEEHDTRSYRRLAVGLLGAPAFRWLCFFLGVLLLSWPFLASLEYLSFRFSFLFYFTLWLVFILVIVAMHIFVEEADESTDDKTV